MIEVHVSLEIGRRMAEAALCNGPEKRVSHVLELKLVKGDRYTAGLKTLVDDAEVIGELFLPCVVKGREDL